ncbi:MAG: alkyl sulfatase C-terminal domain-containing protein [Candidatus Entotheonellia bacterium]
MIVADPVTFINYHRVRIDPQKAENIDKVVAFAFPKKTVALHVRRGVAEYVPDPANYLRQPDISLALDGPTWAQLYLNQTDLKQATRSGAVRVTQGDAAEAVMILDLFDTFEPARNVTIPLPRD